MEKRLFIAIPISKEISEELEEYKKRVHIQNIRWTSKNNFHITLYFIGNVNEENISTLVAKLKEIYSKAQTFTLTFEKITFAPPNRAARMIWAQFHKNLVYEKLILQTNTCIKSVLQNIENYNAKDLIPHLTLARFKFPLDPNKFLLKQPEILNLNVQTCQLIESELDSDGPIYKIISDFTLNKL